MLHPQLETFLDVVECGSFNRAALQRNCSTVSIMNQINNLEERLGLQLLIRSNHGVSLTEAGKIFYSDAVKLKVKSSHILKCAKELSASKLQTINIGNSYLRPCKPLLEKLQKCNSLWKGSFQIKIVPFSDAPKDFSHLRERLGTDVDCFISPYDSVNWINNFAIYHLGYYKCCISVPTSHPLAHKKELIWDEMKGETLMLVATGISPVVDQIRFEIELNHPDIQLADSASYYDVETFNMCLQKGYLMEIPEIWSGIHPGFVTLPVAWPYKMPFGVIFSKRPSPGMERFIHMLSSTEEQAYISGMGT